MRWAARKDCCSVSLMAVRKATLSAEHSAVHLAPLTAGSMDAHWDMRKAVSRDALSAAYWDSQWA